jgi:hypothetical protein
MKQNMLNISFNKNPKTKKFVLSFFGKGVDEENYIVENDTKQRVLDSNGQEITLDRFGGIKNGSEIYVKDDIVSIVDFYERFLSER